MTIWFWIITHLQCTQQQLFFIKTSFYFFLFKSLIFYIQGLVFKTKSITNVPVDQSSMQPLLKMLLILTLSLTLNLEVSVKAE